MRRIFLSVIIILMIAAPAAGQQTSQFIGPIGPTTPDIGEGTGTSLVLTGNLSAEDVLLEDSDASHYLVITTSSNLTAERILTLVPGDAARTVTLSGNPTLADWFDQDVQAAASPSFVGITLTGANDFTGGTLFSVPNVEVVTTTKTTTLAESGEVYTNTGDTDGSTYTLLNDSPIGAHWIFVAMEAQTMTISPSAGETIEANGSVCADVRIGAAVGESITLMTAEGGAGGVFTPLASHGGFTCTP